MKGSKAGLFISGFAMIFILVGGWQAWKQDFALRTYQPVSVTLGKQSIEIVRGSENDSHRPIAEYTYRVDGQEYHSKQVTILNESSGYDWARRRLNLLPKSGSMTAYYNPKHPDRSFLIREVSFLPYIFILFPMVIMVIGLGVMLTPTDSQPGDGSGLRSLKIIMLTWNAVGIAVLLHYLSLSPPFDLLAKVGLSLYGLIGVLMLYAVVYKSREQNHA